MNTQSIVGSGHTPAALAVAFLIAADVRRLSEPGSSYCSRALRPVALKHEITVNAVRAALVLAERYETGR